MQAAATTAFMHTYSRNEDFAAQQRTRRCAATNEAWQLGSWQVETCALAWRDAHGHRTAPAQRARTVLFVTTAQKKRHMNTYA
jgi:hypothetical protein